MTKRLFYNNSGRLRNPIQKVENSGRKYDNSYFLPLKYESVVEKAICNASVFISIDRLYVSIKTALFQWILKGIAVLFCIQLTPKNQSHDHQTANKYLLQNKTFPLIMEASGLII